jgi:hypothetical protein
MSARRQSRLALYALAAAAVALALALAPRAARADGAFPDSSQVLLPAGQPNRIILGTNFGVISTDDGGATWEWACETPLLTMGQAYQLGVPGAGPPGRLLASSLWGVVHSDDGACTWTDASGDIGQTTVTDFFADVADPTRVLAIGVDPNQASGLPQLAFASADGGTSFGAPTFTAPSDSGLLGIEVAASDPLTIYLAMYATPEQPRLVRTRDGGTTWDTFDLQPALGTAFVRILAVDPNDPLRIFLRVSGPSSDGVAVSTDGGATVAATLTVSGGLSAFVRRANGTILAGGLAPDGSAFGYRSIDGGMTFAAWPNQPHLRALAERDSLLYAAADNFADGFALARSADEGATWQPLLRYNQVARVAPCVAAACANTCRAEAQVGLWPASMCEGAGPAPDAAADAAVDASSTGSGSSGCACGAAAAVRTSVGCWSLLAMGWLAWWSRRRRPGLRCPGTSGRSRRASGR